MKKVLMNKKGFTLLEIVVVMIIVGVLAAIALPNLFANVERQRAQEAITTIGVIRNAVETCLVSAPAVGNCTFSAIGVSAPPGALFTYTITGLGGAVTSSSDTAVYTILATRNTIQGGAATSTISLTRSNAGVVKGAAGAFVGVWQ